MVDIYWYLESLHGSHCRKPQKHQLTMTLHDRADHRGPLAAAAAGVDAMPLLPPSPQRRGGLGAVVAHGLHRLPLLDAVQQDPVGPRDGAPQVRAAVAEEVELCDTQLPQGCFDVRLVRAEDAGGVGQVAGREAGRREGLRVLHPPQPVAGHELLHGRAVGGHRPQDVRDDPVAGLGHVGRHDEAALQDGAAHLLQVGAGEGQGAAHHEVQQDAQGPDVGILAHVDLLSEELGGGVGRGAAGGAEGVAAAAGGAEAKVAHLDAAAGRVEDVLRLQVPVDDVVVVLWQEKKYIYI